MGCFRFGRCAPFAEAAHCEFYYLPPTLITLDQKLEAFQPQCRFESLPFDVSSLVNEATLDDRIRKDVNHRAAKGIATVEPPTLGGHK